MRTFAAFLLISALPLASAFAADSDYYPVHLGNTSGTPHTMDYYDDGGYARSMVPSALLDSGSKPFGSSPMSYSTRASDFSRGSSGVSQSQGASSQDSEFHSRPQASATTDSNQSPFQP
jgi:hypothetical protein